MTRTSSSNRADGDRLLRLVDDFAGLRVAVFGDLIVDEFIYGEISRVSREAPVLILDYDSTEIVPGGAGNAANNVAALGGNPVAIGVAGSDETGRRMLQALRERALRMGALAEAILAKAWRAIRDVEPELAAEIRHDDLEIDRLDVEIDEQVLKILATDPGSVKDFQAFSKQTGNALLSSERADAEFIFFMKKK